ncbi:MAG: ribosome maturation factor RimM [bacterium]
MLEQFIEIARIVKPQGLKGELRVRSYTSTPFELNRYRTFYYSKGSNDVYPLQIEWMRCLPKLAVLKFKGVDDRSSAEELRDQILYIHQNDLPQTEENEYFIRDLVGLQVYSEAGDFIGTLTEVLELPANDVYQIQRDGEELLIPAISTVVLKIDLALSKMIIRL